MTDPERHLSVLLIEDSDTDAELIMHRITSASYETQCERVENAEQLFNALGSGHWDVVLSDHSLPEFNAEEALSMLQQSGVDLPFIIVSGAIGEETAVRLMKAGAHDYIMKDNLARLVPAIERERSEARMRKERKDAEERVRASLREKEVMLKEIHHRVKNNLQIICSLLNLQQTQITDAGMRELYAATQRRIRSMALVHEKLYHSADLSVVDLEDYVGTLSRELLRGFAKPGVTISSSITNVTLAINCAIPFGLMLNELLANSLKHGFPDGKHGEIHVSVTREKTGLYLLIVQDTGIGFPASFDMKGSDTIGLQIVRSLVEQLDGSYETRNSDGAVTAVRFPGGA